MIKSQFNQNKAGWKKSFLDGISQDQNGNYLPWMSYPAIEFLQKTINKNHSIFEFGCGSSTVFFAQNAGLVTSIETNKKWLEIISQKLQEKNLTANITLMENGIDNDAYQTFPENLNQKFDFIIIDSIKRFFSAKNAINALKTDGIIILDDSERPNYQKIFTFLAENGFKAQNFEGIEPGKLRVKQTTVFRR